MTILDRHGHPLRATDRKAVTGAGVTAMLYDRPLWSAASDPQMRMAQFLGAYKCGWFYKAESKISRDLASLAVTIMDGGEDGTEIEPAPRRVPFDQLDPVQQLCRLFELPNPNQTWTQLAQKQAIRKDMAGPSFWYLEGGDGGLPTALYGISPARMWPSRNPRGDLVGWVMDYDGRGGGTPFTTDEILVDAYASTDDNDVFGVGVVEAVWAELRLTDLIAKHTGDLLTTGGRLAGMISPKNRSLDEDEYQDVMRAWRNVSSDPNAARRLLVFPEPMEWTSGASTPAELGLPELAALNRDDILTAFPISPTQLGAPGAGGLNSGETRRYEKEDYWQNTIHPRADALEEVLRLGLVDRYVMATGRDLDIEIEEPLLDDADRLISKAGAVRALINLGFDPSESIAAAGLDHIKWDKLPPDLDPFAPPPAPTVPGVPGAPSGDGLMVNDTERGHGVGIVQPVVQAKARSPETREEVVGTELTGLQAAVHEALREQRERLIPLIEASLPKTKAARQKALPDGWWDPGRERDAFLQALRSAYRRLAQGALGVVANNLGRIVYPGTVERILERTLERAGARISDINETTRQAIADALTEGTRRGYSISQLVSGVPAEGFSGLQELTLANGASAWDTLRAETIARTETTSAYNESAITGYREYGVEELIAIDGDGDDECRERDGQPFSIDEAFGIDDHPNGTLDWIPVLDKAAKAQPAPVTVHVNPVINLAVPDYSDALKAIAAQPAPTINVTSPAVTNLVDVPSVSVTNEVGVPQVINEVVSPSVTVNNDVKTPEVTVHNDVATPQVNVTNEVVTPAVNVTNEVKTPDVHVTNEVVSPAVNVTNELTLPEQKAPIVNVKAPIVNVTAEPIVTVVSPPAPEVTDVRVVDSLLPPRTRTVTKRDRQGRIEEISEG